MGKRLYVIDEDYFDNWSNEMAYILGFVSADGSIYNNTLSIEIKKIDQEILEFICSQIGPTTPIKKTKQGKYIRIRFTSKKLIKSLAKYNIITNKTHQIQANFDIPTEFLGDYLRGLFDGDGWVHCRRNSIASGIVSGSNNYLHTLKNYINIGKIRSRKKSKNHNILYYWEMNKNDSIIFRDIIYKSNIFALKRKKNIFYSNFYTPNTKWWTHEQIEYLKNEFKPKTKGMLDNIATQLNKSRKSVSKKIWELNLVQRNHI